MRRLLLLFIVILVPVSLLAQEHVFFSGFFPEAGVTKRLSNGNKINFKIENQEIFFRNDTDSEEQWQLTHYRTDLMAFYDWKVRPNLSVAFGVFHRIQDGPNANRIIQQMAFIQRLRNFRLAHRIRTDQTFEKDEQITFRLRYRLAMDIPLEGATLDPGEPYLVISNEPIIGIQGSDFDLENRLVLTFGKLISQSQKIEYSVDYRTDGYLIDGFRTRLWGKIGYFHSF